MPFILVNHDSFISDGPVLVKLQVEADRLCGERTQRGSADTSGLAAMIVRTSIMSRY
jgi:hypothetical protein